MKYVKCELKTIGNTWQIYAFLFYNHGIKELITHYCDSIHNREYQNFYYRDSIIFIIAQAYYRLPHMIVLD